MDVQKLAPWNWFKKEDELKGASVPIKRNGDVPARTEVLAPWSHEIDRLFDEFFRGFGMPSLARPMLRGLSDQRAGWLSPSLDIASSDTDYTVTVELPGVDEKDVQVELSGDTLRVHGEKKHESENKGTDYYSMERSYGSFQRVLSLPADASADDINATFKNGVMTITIPRVAAKTNGTKRIAVHAS